jgi:CheY-like chemotaxis protein
VISVLLIDDDPDLLYITGLALGEEDDFSLTPCSSPAEALELTELQRFDVIVCDYYMPGMDGCSLMALLRQNGSSAQHILYSGKSPDNEITDAFSRSIDAYIQRQGNPTAEYRELKEIIRTAFSAGKPSIR